MHAGTELAIFRTANFFIETGIRIHDHFVVDSFAEKSAGAGTTSSLGSGSATQNLTYFIDMIWHA